MKMRRFVVPLLICLIGLMLTACASDPDANQSPGTLALYEAKTLDIPMPNDLVWMNSDQFGEYWFSGDCTPPASEAGPFYVCLPPDEEADPEDDMEALKVAINDMSLQGLSPNMYLTLPFFGEVDPATFNLITLNLSIKNPQADMKMLNPAVQDFAVDYEKDAEGNLTGTIKLIPNTPFSPGARHVVVLRGATATNGDMVKPSAGMQALLSEDSLLAQEEGEVDSGLAQLEPLRVGYNGIIVGLGLPREEIQMMWTFTTAPVTLKTDPTKGVISYDNIFGGIDEGRPYGAWGAKFASSEIFSSSAAVSSRTLKRSMDFLTVLKFVSIPPSQRLLT